MNRPKADSISIECLSVANHLSLHTARAPANPNTFTYFGALYPEQAACFHWGKDHQRTVNGTMVSVYIPKREP